MLAHSASFAIEFLQHYFRECRSWGIAKRRFTRSAVRKCDVNRFSGNPVAAVNGVAIFISTADFDFRGLVCHGKLL